MCGFAGEFLFNASGANLTLVCEMAALLRHRGPDESGRFLSTNGSCAIGFQRLAIIDLAGSHQPMSSPDGSVTIAFNGEIYNFRQLRQQLVQEGCQFKTSGDTEVLLHMYLRNELAMLEHLEGMFAIAIYDGRKNRLLLARDRLGEKPLWYADLNDRIVFASEAKALLHHPAVDKSLNRSGVTNYLSFGYVHAPHSIWNGISKLLPGHFLVAEGVNRRIERYWRPRMIELPPGPQEQIQMVREMIEASVQARMIADVPLGALLSGGVDSSIIVALMCKAAGKGGGVKTFCAGLDDPLYDERAAAREVARHCGSEHTELLVRPAPSAGMIDDIVSRYDEPFADSSAIPTFLICKAAREHVTVALTGDGGDEMFGGYDRYRALHLADTLSPLGYLGVRVASGIGNIFAGTEERSRLRRLARFADAMTQPFATQYLTYRSLFQSKDLPRLFSDEFSKGTDLAEPARWFSELFEKGNFPDEVARAQHHDLMTYLPDDLLVKSDIASMASSLELRAPMLDHQLVPVGLSLPVEMKIHRGRGKHILRQAFQDILPPGILNLPKRGFGIPLGKWLRRDLAGVLKETLLDRSFLDHGIVRKDAMEGLVNDHLSGVDDHRHRLWALLVLARWAGRSK
jgi:asparagine synthase (glutamine-hydrolysing)